MYRVYNGSLTGEAIFGHQIEELSRSRMEDATHDALERNSTAGITRGSLAAAQNDFLAAMHKLDIDPYESVDPWHIVGDYRGVDLPLSVHSPLDLFKAKRAVLVIAVVVETKVLDPFLCENDFLVGARKWDCLVKVDDDVIASVKKAREIATSMVAARGLVTGQQILATLKLKSSLLKGLDNDWRITYEFFNKHVGTAGEKTMMAQTIACLPSLKFPLTFDVNLEKLALLKRSKLFEFVGLGHQELHADVVKWVKALQSNTLPEFKGESTAFVKSVKEGLAFFLKDVPSGLGQSLKKSTSYSKVACDILMDRSKMQQATKKKDAVDSKIVTQLTAYSWLLSAQDRVQLMTMRDTCMVGFKRQADSVAGKSTAAKAAKVAKSPAEELAVAKMASFLSN